MLFRDDPVLKDKVQKNPELTLIGMDPKAILSKHQNDFQQVNYIIFLIKKHILTFLLFSTCLET